MLIRKSQGDLRTIQSSVAIPILSQEIVAKNSKCDFKTQLSPTCSELITSPWILLELATQYYYYNLLGNNHPLCRMLYFSDAELKMVKSYILECFKNVTFSRIKTDIAPYELWQVKVNGINNFGIAVIQQIKIVDQFTAMLHKLYIDDTISSFSDEEGLYECLCDKTYRISNLDPSMQNLMASKFLRSIDITKLDISQIMQCDLLGDVLATKNTGYIYVDKISSSVKLKTLCWV